MGRSAGILSVVHDGLEAAEFGRAEYARQNVEDVGCDSILKNDARHVNAVVTKEPFDAIKVLRLAGLVQVPEVLSSGGW
jgi:hypothetical protein